MRRAGLLLLLLAACKRPTPPTEAAPGVVCWGNNQLGQLGDFVPQPDKQLARIAPLSSATAIFAGSSQVCGKLASGWRCQGGGSDEWAAAMLAPEVTQHATGTLFHCALAGGQVLCEGGNLVGQLGRGVGPDPSTRVAIDVKTGQPVGKLPGMKDAAGPVQGITNATAMAAGGSHACALLATAGVVCWGNGSVGQLGDGTQGRDAIRHAPVAVKGLTDATAIAAADRYSCAVRKDGTVACWGTQAEESYDPNERGADTPQPIAGVQGAIAVAVSKREACARSASQVWCWRKGGAARLRPDLAGARDVQLGWEHGCALGADGTVACWGGNMRHELGQEVESSPVSTALPVPGVGRARAISTSGGHTCALL